MDIGSLDFIQTSERQAGILQVTLNRAKQLNALSNDLLSEINRVIDYVQTDDNIKGILLTGNGKAFSAGADIQELKPLDAQSGYQFSKFGQQVFRRLETLGKPIVAAINGVAMGGGCELALATTIRIATPEARFAQPEIKLGVIPGFGGTQRLARLVGKGRALELCLTGRTMNSSEALKWGIISEIVDLNSLLSRGEEILLSIINQPRHAISYLIAAIQSGLELSITDAYELEASYFGLSCATKDKQEGVNAFLEKRTPSFTGN